MDAEAKLLAVCNVKHVIDRKCIVFVWSNETNHSTLFQFWHKTGGSNF